jgi:hypothetical protein
MGSLECLGIGKVVDMGVGQTKSGHTTQRVASPLRGAAGRRHRRPRPTPPSAVILFTEGRRDRRDAELE